MTPEDETEQVGGFTCPIDPSIHEPDCPGCQ